MSPKGVDPYSSKRLQFDWPVLSADVVLMFLPVIVGLMSLIIQIVMHFFFWNFRPIRSIAFPLFLVSLPLFLVVAFVSLFRATDRGCLGVLGTLAVVLMGLGLVACTWVIVLFGGFEMK